MPQNVVDAIATGLTAGRLSDAKAVKSHDFSSVYFVSARMRGDGLDDVGTWATNRLDGTGTYMAVDGFAKEFSDWPDGDSTDADVTLGDDGATESRDCVG